MGQGPRRAHEADKRRLRRPGSGLVSAGARGGARNVWMMKMDGGADSGAARREMRKITQFTTAAFDPTWADSALIFAAFEDFRFRIRTIPDLYAAYDSSKIAVPVELASDAKPWQPKTIEGESEAKALRYTGQYSLDIAQSQIATDPVFGTNGGACLALSDPL